MWCTGFCISKCHTWHFEFWWKIHCINHLFCPCFIYVYTVAVVIIQCEANITRWIAMGWPIQEVCGIYIFNHTGSRVSNWISFQSNCCAMWNWSNNWWHRRGGKRIFRVIFACGGTWYHSLRVQLVSDLHRPNTKW